MIRPATTHALDLEAELAVVIGRRARRVTAADALAHVAAYATANDISARDLQGSRPALREGERGDGQWLRAKGSDTFLPLGPCLVTADELGDPGDLRVRGFHTPASGPAAGARSGSRTAGPPTWSSASRSSIAFISASITLEPGDLVITGTPSGVGVFREPPVFLEPGDVVRVEVEGIGSVTNPVVDADGAGPRRVAGGAPARGAGRTRLRREPRLTPSRTPRREGRRIRARRPGGAHPPAPAEQQGGGRCSPS